jgi:hypothetical protein
VTASPRLVVMTEQQQPGPGGEEQVVVARVLVARDRLDAGRSVHVPYGGDPVGPVGPDVVNEEHVG